MESAAHLRLGGDPDDVGPPSSRSVARRNVALLEEIAGLDAQLNWLVAEVAQGLVSLPALFAHHAATLLVLAGDNPERLGSEAFLASLCGVSLIEASWARW